ncbi:MAG: DUF1553 domain-containing protein, partial [Bacteroidetes bacterium]|nr:DUF1553 domain-containing protein [Bacteroidota bacterium]
GLILQNEEMAMAGGDSGPVIIPGKASESEIIRRLKLPRNHDDAMPPKGKILPEAEIALIEFWINQGAHWADEDLKIFREAPLALEKPKIPSVSSPSQDPIDLLVSDYFQKQKQPWQETVNDDIFIRRVYLDAIGLLPSTEEISRFKADKNANKREILIDSLLNDTHNYAQHWLSFWNDLLRNDYTGTGFITGGREQISDWLYQSLTDNKPYNQMVRELLNPEPESRGFIKGIQWRGVVNASQRTEMQAAQNISQSLLGLNLKCASCHDSFISNLTLEQAYGFANVFADSALEIHRCDKPTGKMAETAFLYPELGTIEAAEVKDRLTELANAVVQPENGRLYRTIVNRLWARLFGRGIIAPVDEMDRLPWSQELLDWLAADFIEHGYDLKRTIGIIMKSQAYQLPSVGYENILEINSENFLFHGPIRKRLSAEQFADALSQVIIPVYPAVTFNPLDKEIPAQWIWDDEIEVDRRVLPKPGERFFRHSFSLDKNKKIESAEILISADHQFSLFLNEEKIGEGTGWRNVYRYQVNENLKSGENLLAIKGINDGDIPNPAGILLSLQIIDNQGDTTMVYSDRSWVSAQSASDDWTQFSFDDSDWKSVRSFGRPLRSPWGQLLAFKHGDNESTISFGRASMVKLDPFQKALGRPSRENVTTSRDDRATLLQALELTNGDFFTEVIQLGAEKWKKSYEEKPEVFIEELYMKALGRKANQKEKKIALNLLGEHPGQEEVEDMIWEVLMLPEFQV